MQTRFFRATPAWLLQLLMILFLFVGCVSHEGRLDLRNATVHGSEDAQTEVIIFSDFQCPFCKKAAAGLNEAHIKLPNDVKVYYKHYPLSYHPQALNAAKAAEAARVQGKFWEMHDLLFAYSQYLHIDIYSELANQLELDVVLFEKDMNSFETSNRISADRAEGHAIGVESVPFVIIDGIRYIGPYSDLLEILTQISEYK